MNNDLISREDLKKALELEYNDALGLCSNEVLATINLIIKLVDNAQAVDISGDEYFPGRRAYFNGYADGLATARPKGKWACKTKSTFPQYQSDEFECSSCKYVSTQKFNFCPNCGADMKGGAE